MVISDLSIKRPVFATVLSMVLIIFGLFAFLRLTVRELPNVDPPIVSVSAVYLGASAEIIESEVTQVLEDAIAGIEGITRLTSSSREDSAAITIEFDLSRDIESATNDVRDRVARSVRALPRAVDTPRVAKTESDAQAIMWVTLSSERQSIMELTDFANRFVADRLSTVPGVAQVQIGGGQDYAMRIWIDKRALAARSLTVADVDQAIKRQNIALPSGRIEATNRELSVRTESTLSREDAFKNIIIAERTGYLVRLGEVADVLLAPENDRTEYRVNGKSSVGIGIVKQSRANTLDVAKGVREIVETLKDQMPPGVVIRRSYDQSTFIERAIHEVYIALGISLALVVAVNFVFLRNLRATAIPAVAIPVSVIATFIVLAAMGYSINILTLLALVISIGLVVDDAIVVLENVHRRIEEGEPPLLASLLGTRQIAFAVISTTVVLVSVFVPISFMSGNTGRLFSEFGITVAAAVIFSAFVALTLTPMMCSIWLREPKDEGWVYRVSERGFRGLNDGYGWLLRKAMNMPLVVVAFAVAWSLLAVELWRTLPQEFAPIEDRGTTFISVTAPEGASLEFTRRNITLIEQRLKPLLDKGEAEAIISIIAPSFGRPGPVNVGFSQVALKPWEERKRSQQEIVREIFPQVAGIPGVRAFAVNPATLGRNRFGAPVQLVIGGPNYETLIEWRDRIIARVEENPGLVDVGSDYKDTQPELRVEIDRNRAADLGVSIDEIGRTLETFLGSSFSTTFDRDGKRYNVILQGRADDRNSPSDLSNIYVRSSRAQLIPLSSLVSTTQRAGAKELKREDRLRSITVTASLSPTYTLGEAVTYLEKIAAEELPSTARTSFGGQTREFKQSSGALYVTFALALLIAFLALAAQFESFIHPVIIMLSVPLAMTGALLSLRYTGISLNIYSQIGVIMLIGLTAKNAILIVEFANQLRDAGRPIRDAVQDAAKIRLRPILMTSIATAIGALPLAFASGAGAEARQALGVVVVGGVGFSTVLSLFVVPVLYLWLARYTKPMGHVAKRLTALEEEHATKDRAPAHAAE
ncbi:MAG: efflux RND transporter permease subunit [Alphaproteobacteria bacterium]|nr:efflux RND transporter permease subunit [Alphaproteobacteria bacterium]